MKKKTIEEKYHDLVNLIFRELYNKKMFIKLGNFGTKQFIDEISGSIKQLETLAWYIEFHQTNEYDL